MSSGQMMDSGRFSTIWIKTTNLWCSWQHDYLHTWISVSHKQGFRYMERGKFHVTQPLFVQDGAGVNVIKSGMSWIICFDSCTTTRNRTHTVQYCFWRKFNTNVSCLMLRLHRKVLNFSVEHIHTLNSNGMTLLHLRQICSSTDMMLSCMIPVTVIAAEGRNW
jgi:hypothetical protein